MKNGCIERKVAFEDGKYAHVIITDRNYDAKNINDMNKISDIYNLNLKNLIDCIQIHSDIVFDIKNTDNTFKKEGDGLVTSLVDTPIIIYTADCVPIVLIDPKKGVISAVHAGWRGTFAKVSKNAVEIMKDNYGCDVKDIKCIIGPSIGGCCYEVSEDIIKKFNTIVTKEGFKFYIIKDGRYYLDLWAVNKYILEECGINPENIELMNICTSCLNERFFSYRKDNKTSKRIGTIVQIKR